METGKLRETPCPPPHAPYPVTEPYGNEGNVNVKTKWGLCGKKKGLKFFNRKTEITKLVFSLD
jgi:hypothetical protein